MSYTSRTSADAPPVRCSAWFGVLVSDDGAEACLAAGRRRGLTGFRVSGDVCIRTRGAAPSRAAAHGAHEVAAGLVAGTDEARKKVHPPRIGRNVGVAGGRAVVGLLRAATGENGAARCARAVECRRHGWVDV